MTGMTKLGAVKVGEGVRETGVRAGVGRYTGEVVYIFAFDIAYEMLRVPLQELMGCPVAQFAVDTSKRNPRQLFFYRAQMVRLPALERFGARGPMRLERSVKLLPVGAISVTVRVPFAVEKIEDLAEFHDLQFTTGGTLYDEVIGVAEEVRAELSPHLIRPVEKLANEEAYTVFCLNAPVCDGEGRAQRAQDWLMANRRQIAAVLTEEQDTAALSEQEAEDSTAKYLSYYEHDLVVVDWDAALIVDEPQHFDETLYLMELANVQLAELEAYDALLDDVVERAYRDLARGPRMAGYGTAVQRSLREIRVDAARLSDELSNISKFFGDWHLARIYKTIAERFHLSDWYHTMDEKISTLDDLYRILQEDRNHRVILLLEVTMCLLFVIDVVMLFRGAR